MNNTETLNQVSSGYRMPRPSSCPEGVYEVMLQTWDATPERRPTFEYLCAYFEEYYVASEPTGYHQRDHRTAEASPNAHHLRPRHRDGFDKSPGMEGRDSMDLGEETVGGGGSVGGDMERIHPNDNDKDDDEEDDLDPEIMNLARNGSDFHNHQQRDHHGHNHHQHHVRTHNDAPTPMAVV